MDPRSVRRTTALVLLLACLVVLGAPGGLGPWPDVAVGSPTSTSLSVTSTAPVGEAPARVVLSTEVLPAVAADSVAPLPAVRAPAAILVNLDDGRVLHESGADERRSIASTTKIMTAIVALEKLPLDRMVKASKRAADAGESEIWLEPGEELSVEHLLYALMVRSANDAAIALAEAASGDLESFVEAMNAKAAELGLTNTHFANPHGLEAKEHYSSARDLATLAVYAMRNEEFRKLAATPKIRIPWPGREYERVLENRNSLVGSVSFVTGIKTGYTGKAGFCLVGSASRDGCSLVSVVLGGKEKGAVNDDTVALLEWGFAQYRHVSLTEEGVDVAELDVPYHLGETLALATDRALLRTVHVGDAVTKTVSIQEKLVLPVERGQALGSVVFSVEGDVLGEVQLVSSRSIEAPTLRVKLRYLWDHMMRWLGKVA